MESKIPFFHEKTEGILIEGKCDCEPHFRGFGAHPRWVK